MRSRTRKALMVLGLGAMAIGCAAGQPPQRQLARTQAAVRAAEEVGAEQTPDAALHLKLARDQVQQAAHFVDARDYEKAASVLRQAELDAELAIAISERQRAVRRAAQASEQLRELEQETGADETMGDGIGGVGDAEPMPRTPEPGVQERPEDERPRTMER
jgi:hypothetical protein